MGLISKFAGSFVKERVSNTTTALQLIKEDFKRYIAILKWIFIGFSLTTILYNIFTKTGNLVINICLIGILGIYSILDAVFKRLKKPDPNKKLRIIYAWVKIVLNAGSLVSSVYTLYSATSLTEIKPISIVLTTLSLIMFVLKVLVEICFDIFESKWKLLKGAMTMDAKEYPGTSGRLFSPLIGDVEEIEVKDSIVERIKEKQSE